MRSFFIDWSEKLLVAFAVIALVMVVVSAIASMFSGAPNGFLMGLGILVGGVLGVIIYTGLAFVAYGIYRNGQETNRLLRESSKF